MKSERNTNNQFAVTKLELPERQGDWHDKPLRWKVSGNNSQFQLFSTKKGAMKFRSILRKSDSMLQAIHTFAILH